MQSDRPFILLTSLHFAVCTSELVPFNLLGKIREVTLTDQNVHTHDFN